MTAKHTPGPWEVLVKERVGAPTVYIVRDRNADELIRLSDKYFSNADANARLIAAAPELLETCKAARQLWNDFLTKKESFADYASRAQQVQSMLADAIAKAGGRT